MLPDTPAQASIRAAFLAQLKKQALEKIKVAELCRAASVNRSTFYAYYTDIFDLHRKMTDALLRLLAQESMSTLNADSIGHRMPTRRLVESMIQVTLEHRELCSLLLQGKSGDDFVSQLLMLLLNQSEARYLRFTGGDPVLFRRRYTLFLGGIILLWQQWVLEGFRFPAEQLITEISDYIDKNAPQYWA